jgi:hypothetical protein
MSYVPNEKRYEGTEYRRCGDGGLSLPPISLGAWQTSVGNRSHLFRWSYLWILRLQRCRTHKQSKTGT